MLLPHSFTLLDDHKTIVPYPELMIGNRMTGSHPDYTTLAAVIPANFMGST